MFERRSIEAQAPYLYVREKRVRRVEYQPTDVQIQIIDSSRAILCLPSDLVYFVLWHLQMRVRRAEQNVQNRCPRASFRYCVQRQHLQLIPAAQVHTTHTLLLSVLSFKKVSGFKAGLTRRELLSTHHLLLLAEWFTVPARVVIIEFAEDCDRDDDIWSSPGPSLRFTC